MRLNAIQKFFSGYLLILVASWLYLHFSLKTTEGFGNYLFSFAFSLVPLIGGTIGMFFSKTWGGLKSVIGKAVFFISLGSFSWGFGSMVWSYYNFFQSVAAPYPGIADVGFLAGSLFWIIGILSLANISGTNSGFKKKQGKIILSVSAIVVAVASYYLLVVDRKSVV